MSPVAVFRGIGRLSICQPLGETRSFRRPGGHCVGRCVLGVLALSIGDHDAPQEIRQMTFEAAHTGFRRHPCSSFLVVVSAPGTTRHPHLDHRNGVDRRVELTITIAR